MITERMQKLAGVPINEAQTDTVKIEALIWDNQDRWFVEPHTWTVEIDKDKGVTTWTSREKRGFGTVKHPIETFFNDKNFRKSDDMFMLEMRKTTTQSGFIGIDRKNIEKLRRVLK